jgi:hypothetical protein
MVLHQSPGSPGAKVLGPEPTAEKKVSAVKCWGVVGAFFAAVTVYCIARWLYLGDARPTPQGDISGVSSWTWFWIRANEVLVVGVTLLVQWKFVLKPWIQTRRLSWDGMFCLAFAGLWLQDPLSNAGKVWLQYSSLFVNLGCWQCHVPGWQPSHAENFVEPILFIGVMYAGFLPAWAMLCCVMMRKAKTRWPQMGPIGLISIAVTTSAIIDFVLEVPWLQMNLYAFPGSIEWWSLFPAQRVAMPFNEAVTMGLFCGFAGALRYYRDDKGRSLVERGTDKLNVAPRWVTPIRMLALYGALQTVMFFGYTAPNYGLSLHGGDRPADTYSDQLTNLMCGPKTDQACPGTKIPMVVGPDSARVSSDGKLFAPAGLPTEPTN